MSLTLLETILSYCITTVVVSMCIKKENSSKLVNFRVVILILKVEENKQHFWNVMLYYFKKGKNATETQKKICAVYGESAVVN